MPAEDIDEPNSVAAAKCPPTLIGSAFCIGQDATRSYFLTAAHNFTNPDSAYVAGTSRLFIGARFTVPVPVGTVNYLPVLYKGATGSPSHSSYDTGDLVFIYCNNDRLSKVRPLRLSPNPARKGEDIQHVGVLDVPAYFEHGTTHSSFGQITELSHFLNRRTMNSGASYITSATLPHGLSGGCCLQDGRVIAVNVNGFSDGRGTAESVLQMTKHPLAGLFFPGGFIPSSPCRYASFVADRAHDDKFTVLDGTSIQKLADEIERITGNSAPTWTDEILHQFTKGIWIQNFALLGNEKDRFLDCLLSSLLGFYVNTGIKIPLCITPIEHV